MGLIRDAHVPWICADFKLGEREQLIAEYIQQKNIILELTR